MSYQGPILIREPELRWPIVMLAAIITAAIAVFAAGMQYFARQPYLNSYSQPQLEKSLKAGNPDFEPLREKVLVENLVGIEKLHPFNDLAVELNATVTNKTEALLPVWNCAAPSQIHTVRWSASARLWLSRQNKRCLNLMRR